MCLALVVKQGSSKEEDSEGATSTMTVGGRKAMSGDTAAISKAFGVQCEGGRQSMHQHGWTL